jgi:hypothetical protein
MVKYICNKCGEKFMKKSTYIDHINRKRACDKDINYVLEKAINNTNSSIVNYNKNKIDNSVVKKCLEENKCPYCEKVFYKKSNVIQHMKERCKEIKKIEEEKQTIFDKLKELEEKNNKLEEEVKKLKGDTIQNLNLVSNSNIINRNSNNNTQINSNNNTQNIMMVGYGKEDMSKFSKNDIIKALRRVYGSPIELTKLIHFNPEHPEYHNIYIPKMNEKYAMAYMNNDWRILDRDFLLDKIYDDKKNFVEKNLDEFISSLPEQKIKALQRWIEDSNDTLFEEEYKNGIKTFKEEIKQLLYNNRHMAMIRKKETEKINRKTRPQIEEIESSKSIFFKNNSYNNNNSDSDYISNYSYDENYKSDSDSESDIIKK